jgi:outer membrane protein OmpA-like peptidoglycan-associated protein
MLFVLVGLSVSSAEKDMQGGKDHPLLTRMPDFHIYEYREKDFDSYNFLGKDGKRIPVEGHLYYIKYFIDKGAAQPGELKIIRNIQNALMKVGGKVLQEGPRSATIMIQKGGKETWVEVQAWSTEYILTIVEKEVMKQEVEANAEAMGNDITSTGRVAIYGIYFDTGKAEIKPESDAVIAEIAKLLKNNNSLKVYVVGHTDNSGTFDANMMLSKDRATAVTNSLVSKHGIASSRLKAYGVSSLNPIASNKTEEGKAKNRRVELVEQ